MIESLHSPHVARVKALIGSRGVKERRSAGFFVAEGLQAAREALTSKSTPFIKHLYVTNSHNIPDDITTMQIDVVMGQATAGVNNNFSFRLNTQGGVS